MDRFFEEDDILPVGRVVRVKILWSGINHEVRARVKESSAKLGEVKLICHAPYLGDKRSDPDENISGAVRYKLKGMRGIRNLSIFWTQERMSETYVYKYTEREARALLGPPTDETEAMQTWLSAKSLCNRHVRSFILERINYNHVIPPEPGPISLSLSDNKILPKGYILKLGIIRADQPEYLVDVKVVDSDANLGQITLSCDKPFGPKVGIKPLDRPWFFKFDGMKGIRQLSIVWTQIGLKFLYIYRYSTYEEDALFYNRKFDAEATKDYIRRKTLSNKSVLSIGLEQMNFF